MEKNPNPKIMILGVTIHSYLSRTMQVQRCYEIFRKRTCKKSEGQTKEKNYTCEFSLFIDTTILLEYNTSSFILKFKNYFFIFNL